MTEEEKKQELQNFEELVRTTTPSGRGVVYESLKNEEAALIEAEENFAKASDVLSEEERASHSELLKARRELFDARMEILEPLVEADEQRAEYNAGRRKAGAAYDEQYGVYTGANTAGYRTTLARGAEFDKRTVELQQARDNAQTPEARKAAQEALDAHLNSANAEQRQYATDALNSFAGQVNSTRDAVEDIYSDELRAARSQRHDFESAPSPWDMIMPSWLGGMSSEELGKRAQERQARGYAPSFWERYMPEGWFGGWSSEKVEEWDKAHPKQENSQAQTPANNAPKGPQRYTWWERMGKEDHEILARDLEVENAREVLKGVTVGELRAQGLSREEIHQVELMGANLRHQKVGEGQTQGGGAAAYLRQNAMTITQAEMGNYLNEELGQERGQAVLNAINAAAKDNR